MKNKIITLAILKEARIKDDGRINRATTASNGKFFKNFAYLNDFIN